MDIIRAELSNETPDWRKTYAALDSLLTASKQYANHEALAESLAIGNGFGVLCQILAVAAASGDGGDPNGDRVRSSSSVAMLIAEAAKAESCRPLCLECGLIERLLDLLDRHDCEPVCVQALRALGNLCYDQGSLQQLEERRGESANDCRARINACDGVLRIISVLHCQLGSRRSDLERSEISKRSAGDASIAASNEAAVCSRIAGCSGSHALGSDQLLIVTCGCLHNLTNNNEALQNAILDAGAVPLLLQPISADSLDTTPDVACRFILNVLASLASIDRGREALSSAKSIGTLSELYQQNSAFDSEVLSLLSELAKESDDVKSIVARTRAVTKLMSTVSEAVARQAAAEGRLVTMQPRPGGDTDDEDGDCRSTSETATAAADLLVLILSGDEALTVLLESDGECLIRTVMSWLTTNANRGNELRASAALALGNVARGDSKVQLLANQGVGPALVNVLQELSSASSTVKSSGDCAAGSGDRLTYAVLNTMRNISVPVLGKDHLIECDALPIIMAYVKSPTSAGPVKARALATLRLLVDKRVAVAEVLCADVEFLRQVAILAVDNDSNPFCKAEAMRFVAWTVKAASDKSELIGRLVTAAGAVPALLTLLDADHMLMQGEAIIALLLALRSQPDACREPMAAGDVAGSIAKVLESCLTVTHDYWPDPAAVEGSRTPSAILANGSQDEPNGQDDAVLTAAATAAATDIGTTAAAAELGVKTLHNCLLLINQIIITDQLLPAVLATRTMQISALLRRIVAAAALQRQPAAAAREPTLLAGAVLQALERSLPSV